MIKKFLGFAVVGALLFQAFPADAHDGWHEDHRWGHGYVVRRIPPYRSIFWGGLSYLYAEGLFYRYTPSGYIIVEPPVGAVVPALPPTYSTVVVRGTPYYYYDSTYYAPVPGGYTVVSPAVVSAAPVQPPLQVASPANTQDASIDTYEIQIPNSDGSYTLVVLKKSEKGFVGPQGELYPEHPTVEKLKVLYGKK